MALQKIQSLLKSQSVDAEFFLFNPPGSLTTIESKGALADADLKNKQYLGVSRDLGSENDNDE